MATIPFKLNGKIVSLKSDAARMLLWVLRTDLGLTGAKYGCGEGLCGACTVLVNGEALLACQTPIGDVSGAEIVTIEGLAQNGRLHPIQQAFMEHDALQCGFCTPGMILKAYHFLAQNPRPTQDEIIAAMDDNLCRCGSHVRIVAAVQTAAKQMQQGGQG
ncbi:MAG: (2Fe-2S)-binding protein [Desulfobacterales bacterium]|jgi:aerobic-type carbon monoxide dehydrogenase small subunit (CoxS/CutS family)